MKFLVDVRITDREAAKPYLPAHLEYLNRHFENGTLFFSAPTFMAREEC